MADPSQESSDVSAAPDVADIPDPEVEAYANVRASISPPVLDVEVYANVGDNMHDIRYKCRACDSTSGQWSYSRVTQVRHNISRYVSTGYRR